MKKQRDRIEELLESPVWFIFGIVGVIFFSIVLLIAFTLNFMGIL